MQQSPRDVSNDEQKSRKLSVRDTNLTKSNSPSLHWLGHVPHARQHLPTNIVWNSPMRELIGSVMVSSPLLLTFGTLSLLLYFRLPSTFLPSKGRSITTLGTRWHDFFITLFRYFTIVLFFTLHFFSFSQGMQTRERAHCARSVFPFIKKKKKKKPKVNPVRRQVGPVRNAEDSPTCNTAATRRMKTRDQPHHRATPYMEQAWTRGNTKGKTTLDGKPTTMSPWT